MGRAARDGLTGRERAALQKREILDDWARGDSISGISRVRSIPRHVISGLLEEAGVRSSRPDPPAAAREKRRSDVLAFIREHPGLSVDEVAGATGVHHRTLIGYIFGTEERKLVVDDRDKDLEYTDAEMEEHIRAVWDSLPPDRRGTGLSKKRFTALAADGAPSAALYDRRYGSWTAACAAAGVTPGRTYRRRYTKEYSDDDILDSIALFIEETGLTSYNNYAAWAVGPRPSGAVVILRFGTWNDARRKLLHRGSAA